MGAAERFDPAEVTARRSLLEVVALEGTSGLISEGLPREEAVDAVLQVLARELMYVTTTLGDDLAEQLAEQQVAMRGVGAMLAGLFGIALAGQPGDDEEITDTLRDLGASLRARIP